MDQLLSLLSEDARLTNAELCGGTFYIGGGCGRTHRRL